MHALPQMCFLSLLALISLLKQTSISTFPPASQMKSSLYSKRHQKPSNSKKGIVMHMQIVTGARWYVNQPKGKGERKRQHIQLYASNNMYWLVQNKPLRKTIHHRNVVCFAQVINIFGAYGCLCRLLSLSFDRERSSHDEMKDFLEVLMKQR